MFPGISDADMYFATAAGPDVSDILGPPDNVLDIYADGSPISMSEQTIAAGGPGNLPFFARGDVHALLLLVAGCVMIHLYAEN